MAQNNSYWRCAERHCPARAHTVNDEITAHVNEHNHRTFAAKVQTQEVISKLKTKSSSEQEPSKFLIGAMLVDQDDYASSALPSVSTMGRYVQSQYDDGKRKHRMLRQLLHIEVISRSSNLTVFLMEAINSKLLIQT